MPDVRMPDGAVVRFPNEMPKEQIRDIIASKFPEAVPQQAPAQQQEPAYAGGSFRAATEGSHAGLMGGFDDEITAGMLAPVDAGIDWLKGNGFDMGAAYTRKQQMLDQQKQARRSEHPVASIGGELAGGLALGAGASKAGLTVAGKSLPIIGKTGAAVLEGAGYGGLYGAGEAKSGERLAGAGKGAAIGGLTGGALELAGRGVSRVLQGKTAMPAAISADDLAAQSNALYQKADQAGVVIRGQAVNKLAGNVQLAAGRINKDLRPNTAGIVDDVMSMTGKDISLQELDELRQVVGQSMKNAQPQDVRTLERIKSVIDHFSDNVRPVDIYSGGDIKGLEYLKEARGLWARKAKTEILNEVVEKAKNQATGFENGLVSQMRALANNKNKMRGFSAEEQKMILSVVRRGNAHGVLRALGMLAPNSTFGGLMTGGVGVGAGLLPGALLAGTGMAAKAGAGALTRGKVDALQRAVSSGQIPQAMSQLPNYLRPLIPGGVAASTEIPRLLEAPRGR